MIRIGQPHRSHRTYRAGRSHRPHVDLLEDRRLLASMLNGVSVPINPAPVEGVTFTAVVARFSDADNNTDPSLYSARIDWGNGHRSSGQVVLDPNGGFDILGTYAYTGAGKFRVVVSVRDADGDRATIKTTNIVADAPLTATGTTIDATRNRAIRDAIVATFADANPNARPAAFVATIDWGDGTTSSGRVTRDRQAGGFAVLGTHTYAAAGAFAVQVSIRDGGKSVASTSFYRQISLISDGAVPADHVNRKLINPWGIAAGAGRPWWINDNGTGQAQLDDGAGNSVVALPSVMVPPPNGAAGPSAPTGIITPDIAAHPNDFVVSANGTSGASIFIFATEDGTISGWSPGVDRTHAIRVVDNSASGAVYKGLALLTEPSGSTLPQGQYLVASDFHNDRLDVFDAQFHPVTLPPGAFNDPTLPAGYAPFGVQSINGNLYVTYAQQDADRHDDVAGAGHGFVDVYTPGGFFIQRIGGVGRQPELNSPWGLVMAPSNFGRFSNDLLVGNFGDSHVSAFDPSTGAFLGQLSDAKGNPLTLDGGFGGASTKGLWGLGFGNGTTSGPTNVLYFASGINDEADGLFGSVVFDTVSTAQATSIASVVPDAAVQPQGHGAGTLIAGVVHSGRPPVRRHGA
jgi:uncharacterized protein (TIGR03118 family)